MTRAARRRVTAVAMLTPSLVVFALFFLWPIASVAWLSLHRWDLLSAPRFVGLANYVELLRGAELPRVLARTLAYSLGTVAGAMTLGLALALALHRTGAIGRVLRAAIFSSYVVSWVGVSLLWTYLLDGQLGPVTALLRALGLPAPDWLANPDTALFALVVVSIWKVVGYDMIVYLAALEDVPREILEAARLDGAGPWARLRTIVWPLLAPTTRFLLVTGLLMTFQGFDVVRVMTSGGPASATQIFVHWVYEQAFTYFRMGPAAAAVVLVLIPLAALPWLLGSFGRGEERAVTRALPRVALALAAVFALAEALPYLFLLSGSLKDLDEIARVPPTLWPRHAHWSNYATVFASAPLGRWLLNTTIVSFGIVLVQLPLVLLASYALTFLRAPAARVMQSIVLACLLIPPQVRFVPVYLLLGRAGLLDTFVALIAPHAASALGILLATKAMRAVPLEVVEAARLDGAGELHIALRIVAPMIRPTLVAFALFSVVYHWNDYFWTLVMTTSDRVRTLPVGVALLREEGTGIRWHLVMAAAVLVTLPVLALFALTEKHLVRAFTWNAPR